MTEKPATPDELVQALVAHLNDTINALTEIRQAAAVLTHALTKLITEHNEWTLAVASAVEPDA